MTPLEIQQAECEELGHIWEPFVFSFATIYSCSLGCGETIGDGLNRVPEEELRRTGRKDQWRAP